MSEVSINKHDKSIVIVRGDIAFSQFGIADEILDLIIEQGIEIERLNNIINKIKSILHNSIEYNALTKLALIEESLQGVDKE